MNLYRVSAAVVLVGALVAAAVGQMPLRPSPGWHWPVEVDPTEATERLLLFTPGGPLVIDLTMTIDGAPYAAHRERLIDEAIRDLGGDGQATWQDALKSRRFLHGRLSLAGQSDLARIQTIKQYDLNSDGLVDRSEVRLAAARLFGGPALMAASALPGQYAQGSLAESALRRLLDTDGDGDLSAAELAAVPTRLKSCDTNEDDLLDIAELNLAVASDPRISSPVPAQDPFLPPGGAATGGNSVVFILSSSTERDALFTAMVARYGIDKNLTVKSFPHLPGLFEQLDADRDGVIQAGELAALEKVAPHLVLTARLGETGDQKAGLQIDNAAPELRSLNAGPPAVDSSWLVLPGVKLHLSSTDMPATVNFDAQVNAMLNQFDKDKNGYIDKEDLKDPQAAYVQRQFEQWDADADGKVYAEEIREYFVRVQSPSLNRIILAASDQGPALFTAADTNGDNRLSIREMRAAGANLKALDTDGGGSVQKAEIPSIVRLIVGRGQSVYQFAYAARTSAGGRATGGPAVPAAAGGEVPAWFVRMDTNGDGDLSPREFLGRAEIFAKLDTDGDGLIDPREAAVQK